MNAFPFASPLYVMAKPAGSLCNLRCQYCYYLEKAALYSDAPKEIMSDSTLEKFIDQYINSQTSPNVLFTWHGGEPLMRPLSFYKRVMDLQRQYAHGHIIDNSIQTNGTMLTDEWCEFLHDNGWLVGLSIDGPQEFHDEYRRTATSRPSFQQVMRGIKLMNKHDLQWNAMAVINDFNADYPLDFYHFFKEIDCHYIQFTPIVERRETEGDCNPSLHELELMPSSRGGGFLTDESVTPEQWGNFLITIFDEWVRNDVANYYIQIFDATLANWVGQAPGICTLAKTCGHASALEWNGDLYCCDHFVFPEYKLGNIHEQTITEMMYSERQRSFGLAKQASLPTQCKECAWLFACNGECPKNRFVDTKDGEHNLNYLCEGYQRFFEHVAPYMDFMKNELANQRPPANIMDAIKRGEL